MPKLPGPPRRKLPKPSYPPGTGSSKLNKPNAPNKWLKGKPSIWSRKAR